MIENNCYTVKFGNYYTIIEAVNEAEAQDIAYVELGRRNGPFSISKVNSCEFANFIISGGKVFLRKNNVRMLNVRE